MLGGTLHFILRILKGAGKKKIVDENTAVNRMFTSISPELP